MSLESERDSPITSIQIRANFSDNKGSPCSPDASLWRKFLTNLGPRARRPNLRARRRAIVETLENRVVLSASSSLSLTFGDADDVLVAGSDFDGDVRSELGLFRSSTGVWIATAPPLEPGRALQIFTTDGGTVEGTLGAGAGTLLIELDGNDVTMPAVLSGHQVAVKGPGSISFEGASTAGEILIQTAGFQLTSRGAFHEPQASSKKI